MVWTNKYEANKLPTAATPAWTKNYGPATTEEISPAGYLHIVSSTNLLDYLIADSNFDNSVGTTIEFRVKIISGTTDTAGEFNEYGTGIWLEDGKYATEIDLVENLVREYYGTPHGSTYHEMDTTDDYHVYRITLKGAALKVYVDGILRIERVVGSSGDTTSNKRLHFYAEWQGNDAVEISLDYIYYRTDGAFAPLYHDPILQKIEDIINVDDDGEIKTFFHGDPLFVAKDDLPCLIISKDNTEVGDASNAEDYHRMTVVLTLVVDIRQFFDDTPTNVHVGFQKLYDMMEGRGLDYILKSTSIVDILRKNHNLTSNANIDLETPMTVDYGFSVGRRGEGVWAQEANLSFNIYFTQLRD